MPLYRDSVAGVRSQIVASTLVPTMSEQFAFAYGHRPSPAEVRSWERSLSVLANDLHDAGLDQVEILLEYRLPLTSRRVDALLCGVNPRTSDSSYVVVELKQGSRATPVDGTDDVVLDDGRGRRLHPAAQVGGYCEYIADFNASLSGSTDRLSGVAYLHNADDQGVAGLWEYPQSRTTRMFTGQRRAEFLTFLRSVLAPSPGAKAADDLMSAAIKPSKQLMALAAQEIRDREQFVLIDQQQVAYSMVMRAV
ncbi:MAG: ATP-binding protein, partial [Cryobacterium sp.]|nr:ATP-binding protein [Cryobacterium sp.]